MLSVNQLMSSRAGWGLPGEVAVICSCQQMASWAEVCSITTCVTSQLGEGRTVKPRPLPDLLYIPKPLFLLCPLYSDCPLFF
jgi:hypothetical protein